MDSIQSNKLAMYRSVHALLVKSSEPLREITALPAKVAKLSQKIGEITGAAAVQAQPVTGTVVDRDAAVEDASHTALVLAGTVLSYASEHQLGDLAAKAQLSSTDFRHGRNEERVQLAQLVHDAAEPVLAELGGYGVTAETLDALQSKIGTATIALSVPRSIITARKAATQRLKVMFRQADALLQNQIDPLLVPLTKTNPQWHAKYRAARIIIDYPGGRAGPSGEGSGATAAVPAQPAEPAATASKDKKT